MRTLDVQHKIAKEYLDRQYYFESLMRQAFSMGYLSETEMERIQADLLLILSGQADKWSNGGSSSIPGEKAQDILESIHFVIGVQLKSYPSPDLAVEVLKQKPLANTFDGGLKRIYYKEELAKHTQRRILTCLMDTPNVYYRSTVKDGINGFFKLYSPETSAQEIHITADYPVLAGRPQLRGIEFIEEYLRHIEIENAFCNMFQSKDIHHLLCGLTEDYRSVPMNIFEPVLMSALGLVMLHRNPMGLDLSEEDVGTLYEQLSERVDEEINRWLCRAWDALEQELVLKASLTEYAHFCFKKLTEVIKNAVEAKTLHKVFVVPTYPEEETKIEFDYGERMDNPAFRELIEKTLQMEAGPEKVDYIMSHMHSLADLLDFLSASELCKEEYEYLVNRITPSEFVVLLAQYPNEYILEKEGDRFLFDALQKRQAGLSKEELEQVARAVELIRVSENR